MAKKAQGLSMNVIVIAAIALVVLIVAIGIFSGFVNNKAVPFLGKQTECTTQSNAGKCVDRADCDGTPISGLGCEEPKVCCIK